MKRTTDNSNIALLRITSLMIAVFVVVALLGAGLGSSHALASDPGKAAPISPVAPQATPGQDFQDVDPSNTFYPYLHNLKLADIVSGYACGGSDPCVPPDNLPYYHPVAAVTRQQMTKFIDLGRRNIADAVGHSLYISTTAGIAVDAETRSGGEALYAQCLQSGNNCYALEGYAPTGDYAGYMYGGKGVYAESDDPSQSGVNANSYGNNAYGLYAYSDSYRGGYAKSNTNTNYSMYVDSKDGPSQAVAALNVRGSIRGEGDLIIGGSKAGYVVDIMQNAGDEVLEPGDVVTIVGNNAPVLGQIPVVTVKKASTAYDTGVVGVVDEAWYAPDAATKATYDKQQADLRAADDQRNQATAAANAAKTKPDLSKITMPDMTITDEQGTLHALPGVTRVAADGYLSAVTLGSYKGIKVDASFGPIHAGDVLVASPHAGYAMKGSDRTLTSGATIGKALGDLETGTGLIPVMVTLK